MRFTVSTSGGGAVEVEAANWMVAARDALARFGVDRGVLGRWICTQGPDGVIRVHDPHSGLRWVIEPLGGTGNRDRALEGPPLFATPVRATLGLTEAPLGPDDELAERLFDLSMDIASAGPADASALALELLARLVPCEAASVAIFEDGSCSLAFVAATGPVSGKIQGRRIPVGTGLVGMAFDLGIPVEVEDADHDPRHFRGLDARTGFHTRSVLCVPIRADGPSLGVVELLNPARPFTHRTTDIVETVARTLAGALSLVAA